MLKKKQYLYSLPVVSFFVYILFTPSNESISLLSSFKLMDCPNLLLEGSKNDLIKLAALLLKVFLLILLLSSLTIYKLVSFSKFKF